MSVLSAVTYPFCFIDLPDVFVYLVSLQRARPRNYTSKAFVKVKAFYSHVRMNNAKGILERVPFARDPESSHI